MDIADHALCAPPSSRNSGTMVDTVGERRLRSLRSPSAISLVCNVLFVKKHMILRKTLQMVLYTMGGPSPPTAYVPPLRNFRLRPSGLPPSSPRLRGTTADMTADMTARRPYWISIPGCFSLCKGLAPRSRGRLSWSPF